MWNLKYNTNKLNYKTETDSQTQKTNLWLPESGGDKLGVWDSHIRTNIDGVDNQQSTALETILNIL